MDAPEILGDGPETASPGAVKEAAGQTVAFPDRSHATPLEAVGILPAQELFEARHQPLRAERGNRQSERSVEIRIGTLSLEVHQAASPAPVPTMPRLPRHRRSSGELSATLRRHYLKGW